MQLNAINLHFAYRRRTLLHNISLSLHRPGITALLGVNGAGKTLLMKLLVGQLAPTSGEVSIIHNNETSSLSPLQQAEARRFIGYQPDITSFNYWHNSTIYYLLGIMMKLRCCYSEPALQQLAQQCHLASLLHTPLKHLSLGQQRRLTLAIALVGYPYFIMLDEPSNGLDIHEQKHLYTIMQYLAKTHCVMFTTHRLQEVADLAQHVFIIKDAQLRCNQPLQANTPIQSLYEWYHDATL